jgi:hypothetical protein
MTMFNMISSAVYKCVCQQHSEKLYENLMILINNILTRIKNELEVCFYYSLFKPHIFTCTNGSSINRFCPLIAGMFAGSFGPRPTGPTPHWSHSLTWPDWTVWTLHTRLSWFQKFNSKYIESITIVHLISRLYDTNFQHWIVDQSMSFFVHRKVTICLTGKLGNCAAEISKI